MDIIVDIREWWMRLKSTHKFLIICVMVIFIILSFLFNAIVGIVVLVVGLLGGFASIYSVIKKDKTPPKKYFDEKFDEILKELDNSDPLERDRLIKELKEKNEGLEIALKDERAGNTKERKEALNALRKGYPTKSQELFKRRIEKDKVILANNYLNLGNAYFMDLKFDEALKACDMAIDIKPDYHKAWYNKGVALIALGHYDEAVEAYNKAIEIKPEHQEIYQKGFIFAAFVALGRSKEAKEIKPDGHQFWYNKGIVLEKLGREKEAEEAFKKSEEIKKNTE
jgi:tetratricopeptide (TPR) repeat protein